MAPRDPDMEVPTPDEIKEKINELEKVSKPCANTIGQRIDSYWMMNKDLESKVNSLYSKMDTLFDFTSKLFAETSLLTKLATEQQREISMMCHFKCIGFACNVKKAEQSKEAKEEGTSARPNQK